MSYQKKDGHVCEPKEGWEGVNQTKDGLVCTFFGMTMAGVPFLHNEAQMGQLLYIQ